MTKPFYIFVSSCCQFYSLSRAQERPTYFRICEKRLFSTLHPPLPISYPKQRSFLHCTYYDNPITYWYSSKKISETIFFLDSIVPSFAGGGLVNCSAENAESSSQVVVHDGGDSSCCSVAKYGSRASSQISIPGLDWDSQVCYKKIIARTQYYHHVF